jgi:hypothetical protein
VDEEIIKQHIKDACEKYDILYSDERIVVAPDIEIKIYINERDIHFHEHIDNTVFNTYSINYTINKEYRCYYIDKYRDFVELKDAIEYCIKTILESYKKIFKSQK